MEISYMSEAIRKLFVSFQPKEIEIKKSFKFCDVKHILNVFHMGDNIRIM